uniref:Uncharacterized protein n=1 Tax=Rhodosorus marinus TaxID=101924 RepID=A0A6T6LFT2_9RHOD|mmetsp:Transcript_17213/g.24688  ORF Transcript_17213/g.24688 Transcript_17213/m.24688 type:complete len:109 (+) Transcript_17213:66-392(+)
MKSEASTDLRRPNEKVPWVLYKLDKEDIAPNYYTIVSLVFGVMAITMKVRLHAWLCLLFSLAQLTTTNFSEMDFKQTVGSVMLAGMTFWSAFAQKSSIPKPTATPPMQ